MTWQRTIPFATGRHLGTLYHRAPSNNWPGSSEWWPFRTQQEVHGPVSVPAGAQVRLWASQKAANRWERIPARFDGLRDLAPDDLDSLSVLDPAPGWADDIAHLTGLSELCAEGWDELSDDEFRRLLQLENLVGLDVGYSQIHADRLARLIDANPKLRFVNAMVSNVGDASAGAIARQPLEWLNLSHCEITDTGLRDLSGLTELRALDLTRCAVGDESMGTLAGMEDLRRLELGKTAVSDAGLAPMIGRLGRLAYLSLSDTKVGDATIESLACPSLQYLFLGDTRVTGATLDPDRFGRLTSLSVFGAPVTAAGMERIARLAVLRTLVLFGAPIDDEALGELNGHPTLERIELMDSPVSPRAILDLIESLPKLKRIGRGFEHYSTPEAIAEYVTELRGAPVGARTIRSEHLEPTAGRADTLTGSWTDLGPIVDDAWHDPRVFTHDRFGRLWVGCSDRVGRWNDPEPPAWQAPDWWPRGPGPIVLGNVGGVFTFGPDLKAWIGNGDLWSYDMVGRAKLCRERPLTSGMHVDIAFDSSGRPWVIRTYDEVWRKHRRGWESVEIPDLPKSTAMRAIAAHPDGSMWIASDQGLLRWRRGEWTHWQGPVDGLPESYWIDAWAPAKVTSMNAVGVDSDGAVWASGGTGIVRHRDGEFTCWDHRDGLPPWRKLAADPTTGDVYGLGHHQVGRFDGARWSVVELPVGLRERSHVGIRYAEMRDGRLLVLTEGGRLVRFEPSDLVERQAEAAARRRRSLRFLPRVRATQRRR